MQARTFELPQLAAVVGAGTAGDCVVDERSVRAALAASAGVRIQASNCTAARVDGTPHEGFFNVAIVIGEPPAQFSPIPPPGVNLAIYL